MRNTLTAAAITVMAGVAAPALAQRLPFERPYDVTGPMTLDVSTMRGKIDVTAGTANRVVIAGAATVRVGVDVPADALEIAKRIAANPPIERTGNTFRLRPPTDRTDQKAVTVSYQVQVPPDTEIIAVSDSGATTIRKVGGRVSVRTQSASIELRELGGAATVTTGSGAVALDGVAGALDVTTSSSSITGTELGGSVKVRTGSGAVDVGLTGTDDVDIETASSGVRIAGARGGLKTKTQSGRVIAEGAPARPWTVSTGSGSVEMTVSAPAVTIDAETGSGSVTIDGAQVSGAVTKKRVEGTVGAGGPRLGINSRSGSIRLKVTHAR